MRLFDPAAGEVAGPVGRWAPTGDRRIGGPQDAGQLRAFLIFSAMISHPPTRLHSAPRDFIDHGFMEPPAVPRGKRDEQFYIPGLSIKYSKEIMLSS